MTPQAFDRSLPWLGFGLMVLAIVLLSAVPAHCQDRAFTVGRAVLVSLHGSDTATTIWGHYHNPNWQEGNPMMRWIAPHNGPFVAATVAGSAGLVLVLNRAHRSHPKLTDTLTWAMVGFEAMTVVHNVRFDTRTIRRDK